MKGKDDARKAELIFLSKLNDLDYGFDHKEILRKYVAEFHPTAP